MADRDRIAIEIEKMLAKAQPLFSLECCIYKVPHEIRQLNEDAHTPQLVSVGPFHHGTTKVLLKMEAHKQVYCQNFIERSEANLDNLVSCVRKMEPLVRSCYSESIELGVEELVKVILVDCGFIIELFTRSYHNKTDDVVLVTPRLIRTINLDLLLLENQLPFFVLEKLYNLTFPSHSNGDQHPSFLDLARRFYSHLTKPGVLTPPAIDIAHFTDLLRIFYLQPSDKPPSRKEGPLTLRYSASELNQAGVKFKVNKTSHSMLDLEFSGRAHTLKLPQIIPEDSTEILLRNMVALEKCHYTEDSYITDYIMLLDLLFNTGKDVDVLVEGGIILGDRYTAAKLFKGLAKSILAPKDYNIYFHLCNELNAYYEVPCHTIMATLRHYYCDTLKRDYCNTPWKTVGTVGGIALLILTTIQTVCSFLQIGQ